MHQSIRASRPSTCAWACASRGQEQHGTGQHVRSNTALGRGPCSCACTCAAACGPRVLLPGREPALDPLMYMCCCLWTYMGENQSWTLHAPLLGLRWVRTARERPSHIPRSSHSAQVDSLQMASSQVEEALERWMPF